MDKTTLTALTLFITGMTQAAIDYAKEFNSDYWNGKAVAYNEVLKLLPSFAVENEKTEKETIKRLITEVS